MHLLREQGFFDPIYEIVSRYADSFGLEDVEYKVDSFGSIVDMHKESMKCFLDISDEKIDELFLSDDIKKDLLFKDAQIKKFKVRSLFGIENKDLYVGSISLSYLTRLLASTKIKILRGEDTKSKRFIIENGIKNIRRYVENLPDLDRGIWNETSLNIINEICSDYIQKLYKLTDDENDKRTLFAAKVLKEETDDGNKDIIIGLSYGAGHVPLLIERLDSLGISYFILESDKVETYRSILQD